MNHIFRSLIYAQTDPLSVIISNNTTMIRKYLKQYFSLSDFIITNGGEKISRGRFAWEINIR